MSLRHLGNKNILIVEDDIFNMQLLCTLLTKISDMNIIRAYNGADALHILDSAKKKIDMVLLDIHLPIMNGMELLLHMRQNNKYMDIPVLVISVDKSDKLELLRIGANEFIHKPFNIHDLSTQISSHLTI
jgi:two-component system response regulator AdeR